MQKQLNVLDSSEENPSHSPNATELYHLSSWGAPYFFVNQQGNMAVRPLVNEDIAVDIYDVVQELISQQLPFPILIRFQDILQSRVIELNEAFRKAIREAGYKNVYQGVYPIKVNQLHEVVEEILEAGIPYHFGLECGSKAELVATLPHLESDDTLLICNGYKDFEMLDLMTSFQKLGKSIVPVIEKFSEFEKLLSIASSKSHQPNFGVRIRLATQGSGKWADSSGDHAKFGVSYPELLLMMKHLKETNQEDALELVHIHIGSQISDIQQFRSAIQETARVYANLHHEGFNVKYLDVGGGLGIQYEAEPLGISASINYGLEEYTNTVVYSIKEICDTEEVPHPIIVSESGRFLTAHHSLLVTEVIGSSQKQHIAEDFTPEKTDHEIVHQLFDLLQLVAIDNEERFKMQQVLEIYHDATELRQKAETLFTYGYLDLVQKANAETLFWSVCKAINYRIHQANPEWLPQELESLDDLLVEQYLCDFSVFQSMLDYWSIGQRFPIVPIHRLLENPDKRAILVDLTCDSDGKVNRFISPIQPKRFLEVHALEPNERYFLGFFLMGAYQDILGDMHNLFGRVSEVHVYADKEEPNNFFIENIIPGATIGEMLASVQYFPEHLQKRMQQLIQAKTKKGKLRPKQSKEILDQYKTQFQTYTYYRKHEHE